MSRNHVSVMQEVDATDFFANDSADWKYCMENAPYSHRSVCEFMFPIPEDEDSVGFHMKNMTRAGCSKEFIAAYKDAADQGASWVFFYAG